MAKHVWSLLAQRVIFDRATSQLSLIDLIDQLNVRFTQPDDVEKHFTLQLNLQLASGWVRSNPVKPERATARLVMVSPQGKRAVGTGELAIDLEAAKNARTIFRMGTLRYTGPGTYAVVIELRHGKSWKRVASVPFEVAVDDGVVGTPTATAEGAGASP